MKIFINGTFNIKSDTTNLEVEEWRMKKILIGALCLISSMLLVQQENVSNMKIVVNIPHIEETEVQKEYQTLKIFNKKIEKILKQDKNIEEVTKKVIIEKPTTEVAEKTIVSNNIIFKLSFYTAIPSENGGYGLMANGESVETAKFVVASNYYPLGTRIYLEKWGTFTVKDRGGSHFDSSVRLDVLISRKIGENDATYRQRVLNLGRQTTTGYIIK